MTRILFLVFAYCLCAGSALAQLTRSEAARLLASMGDRNVVVGAVVNGVGREGAAFGSPNAALIIAYAERNGAPVERKVTVLFDQELGWFYSEIDIVGRRVRLWTLNGYKELKAGGQP